VITENSTPENRPADPERRYKLRAWLIDALALGMGGLAVFHYQPEGFAAGIAQACWLWELWPATATLSHPLALQCAAWLALLAIRILAQIVFISRRAPHSLTHRVEMKPTPKTETALISNADRCGHRPGHPQRRVGVTGTVEIDVNDPQNEQSDKGGGNGFHKLLTMRIRHRFRGRNSCRRYGDTKGGDSEWACPGYLLPRNATTLPSEVIRSTSKAVGAQHAESRG